MKESSARKIVNKFGGTDKTAQLMGINRTVVQYWLRAGHIPYQRHDALMRAAKDNGIEILPTDLVGI